MLSSEKPVAPPTWFASCGGLARNSGSDRIRRPIILCPTVNKNGGINPFVDAFQRKTSSATNLVRQLRRTGTQLWLRSDSPANNLVPDSKQKRRDQSVR